MAIELIENGDVPVDLIGHSFGATVALRIAVERPDLAYSLTLIEPVFFSAAKDAGRAEFDEHLSGHSYFFKLLDEQDFDGAAKAFSDFWGSPVAWEDIPKRQRAYMAERIEMIRAGAACLVGQGPEDIPLSRIGELTLPVLLVVGGETDPVIRAVNDSLASVLGHSKRVVSGTIPRVYFRLNHVGRRQRTMQHCCRSSNCCRK